MSWMGDMESSTVPGTSNKAETKMKEILVANLLETTQPVDLQRFFNLKDTDEHSIAINSAEENGNIKYFAVLKVRENIMEDILRKNGTNLNGNQVVIEEVTVVDNTAPQVASSTPATLPPLTLAKVVAGGQTGSATAENRHIHEYVLVDTTRCNDCYNVPTHAAVVRALGTQFPKKDDPDRVVLRQWGRNEGTWKIETTKIENYRSCQHLTYEGRHIATIEVRRDIIRKGDDGQIRREPERNRREASDDFQVEPPDAPVHSNSDLLITLFQANTERFNSVSNEDLLREIITMGVGDVKKAPQPQRFKGTDELNGNKFFVLSNVNEDQAGDIPSHFLFFDQRYGWQRMWLNHRLRKQFCGFCGVEHELRCEMRALHDTLIAERNELKASLPNKAFEAHVISDSILRYADQECVAVDIHVMSGGSTNNILNAVDIDTEHQEVNNLILVAGQNELQAQLTDEEFLLGMKMKEERLTTLAAKKNIAILKPPPQNQLDPVEQAKELLFHEHLSCMEENVPNIKVWPNPVEAYSEDGGRHPSPEETMKILHYIDLKAKEDLGVSIFLKSGANDLITTKKKYRGVKALYKYGCAACADKGRNKWWQLCTTCADNAKLPDENGLSKALDILYRKAREIRDEENPALPGQEALEKNYRERSPLKKNDETTHENDRNDENVGAKRIRLFHEEQDK